MNQPTTIEEARSYRYGVGPDNPRGNAYRKGRCIAECKSLFDVGLWQCPSRATHEGYCVKCYSKSLRANSPQAKLARAEAELQEAVGIIQSLTGSTYTSEFMSAVALARAFLKKHQP